MATTTAVENVLRMVDVMSGKTPEEKRSAKQIFEQRIKSMLPAHIKNHDLYVGMFESIVNDKLKDKYVSNKESILPCVFQAVKFGLYPDPAMGQIYFIPYKGVLTYQLGYKGLIRLALNAGYKDVSAGRVFQKEVDSGDWDYFRDEKGDHFKHKPSMEKDRGVEHCVYSIAVDSDNTPRIHVMESWHVDEIKKMVLTRTPNGSPWTNPMFEPEMRKKTCIRRHCKTLSLSLELAEAIETEEAIERGETVKYEANAIKDIRIEIPDSVLPQQETDIIGAAEAQKAGA
jgi:phage RecT family recombinase